VLKELARELKNLDDTPSEDIKVHVNKENFSNITADIEGPCKSCPSLAISCLEMYKLDWERQAHGGSEPSSLMV
jgi:hypothetical protein